MITVLARLGWSAVVLVARWCWRTPAWSGALLPAAGVISVLCSVVDFLPVLALLVVAPMLLLSIAVTLVHRPTGDPTTAWPTRGRGPRQPLRVNLLTRWPSFTRQIAPRRPLPIRRGS